MNVMPDTDVEKVFQTAFGHHQKGNLDQAGRGYQEVLALDPSNANALHLLGVLAIQNGKAQEALELIKQAIAIMPEVADYHSSFGCALQRVGNQDEAIAEWRTAISLNPNLIDAHLNLANTLWEKGEYEQAIAANEKALQLDPRSVTGLNNLGNALRAQGKVDDAIIAYRRAILAAGGLDLMEDKSLRPTKRGDQQPKQDLGMAKVPRHLAADFATACYNLGECHCSAGRHEESLVCYRAAIQADPKFLKAHVSLATALAQLQKLDQAMASYANAAAIDPDASITHECLGEIQLHGQKAEQAVESFRRAVKADPKSLSAWGRLGRALESLGKFDEADECLRKEIETRPGTAPSPQPVAGAEKPAKDDAEFHRMLEISKRPNVTLEERIWSEFGMGRILDEAERYDEAFAHYAEGNVLVKRQREMGGEWYDHEKLHESIDRMIQMFTREFFEQRREWGNPSEVPVFVVGMPRSGTTLVHQIAASHPQVHGAGELSLLQQVEEEFVGSSEKLTVGRWSREKVEEISRAYLGRLREMNGTASRIVDKMPGNIVRMAQIGVLFPRTRVIICRRDARDTCLSCFFQWFTQGQNFSLDLGDCGRRHVEIDRLAAHWIKAKPAAILEVQYETLVQDLEGQSRRLIDFLGLPWDPACLEFYRAETAVLTASIRQVRKPIYQKSVGRWKHYEKHLGPLFAALGPAYMKP
jgi:tetratricopeptide (TPR) repeat protein